MIRSLQAGLLTVLMVCSAQLQAQQAKPAADNKKPKKIFKPTVYLGTEKSGGTISYAQFTELMNKNLTSRDSTGRKYKVLSFDFTYAERNLYEDSVGNLMVTAEYLGDHCPGDTISGGVKALLADRIKSGDTAFFDNVLLVHYKNNSTTATLPDSTAFLGKGMKFILTK
jgi:hypothetical protein